MDRATLRHLLAAVIALALPPLLPRVALANSGVPVGYLFTAPGFAEIVGVAAVAAIPVTIGVLALRRLRRDILESSKCARDDSA